MDQEDNHQQIWRDHELEQISARAERLTLKQLYDLVTLAGIKFSGVESREQASEITKDQYISVLDEIDDKDKVIDFLDESGV